MRVHESIPKFAVAIVVGSLVSLIGAGVSHGANILTDSGFSSATTGAPSANPFFINSAAQDTWLDNGFWPLTSGYLDFIGQSTSAERRRDIIQYVQDDKASQGVAVLSMDIDWFSDTGNSTDPQIGVDVWGWNVGDTPSVDLSMGITNTAFQGNGSNISTLNGATILFSDYAIHTSQSLTSGNGFETVTFDVPLGGGYDFLAVRFQGARLLTNNALEHLYVDNVELLVPTPIPEPASLLLLLSGVMGLGLVTRRRRK